MSIKIKSSYTNYINDKLNNKPINARKRIVDRKVIPNYSLVRGYKIDKNMNMYDKFQTEAIKDSYKLQRNPMGFANQNYSSSSSEDENETVKKNYTEENLGEYYNDVQERAKDIDLTPDSLEIEGGSIWSSLLSGVKSIFPFLKQGVKTVAKNPSIIKDVVDTVKDVKEVIKPTPSMPDKTGLKDDEFLQMLRDKKITPEEYVKLTNTLKPTVKENVKPTPSKKPEKKPLKEIVEEEEENTEEYNVKNKFKDMSKQKLLEYMENTLNIDVSKMKKYTKSKLLEKVFEELGLE